MALEQMRAFRAGKSVWDIGPNERLAPDYFPLLINSDLRREHINVSQVIDETAGIHRASGILNGKTFATLSQADKSERTRHALAFIERAFAHDAGFSEPGTDNLSPFFAYGTLDYAILILWDRGVAREELAQAILEWFTCYRFRFYGTKLLRSVLHWVFENYTQDSLTPEMARLLQELRSQLSDLPLETTQIFQREANLDSLSNSTPEVWLESNFEKLLGGGISKVLSQVEFWSVKASDEIERSKHKEDWVNLLSHCRTAASARPSAKWLAQGEALVRKVGRKEFEKYLLTWFPLVDQGRIHPMIGSSWENVDEQQRMSEANATILRGLLWLVPKSSSNEMMRAVSRLALSAYRKIRGVGPRAVKVGNAAVYALSEMGTVEAVGELAMLQARVKFGTALNEIQKAFNASAAKLNIPRPELEELAVPTYGLDSVGVRNEALGEYTARLTVTGNKPNVINWIRMDGKCQKSFPAILKAEFAEELKDLKKASKDIERMLPAQSERIDRLFLQQKEWNIQIWRERYLNHPLVGILTRRLLWDFTIGSHHVTGIWFNGELVDCDLRKINLESSTSVKLWHPIGRTIDDITSWRSWLDAQEYQQPFKQAHREVYLLTDAERATNIYSNRYAAHILKQHQFSALCANRGWKNKLRLMVDDEYPPATLNLPQWGLRAEFWVEGLGADYGADTNENGAYLYLNTDQVRFYPQESRQLKAHAGGGGYGLSYGTSSTPDDPIPLDKIPPFVFSEVMRDVDLFVGVTSVGNDPSWFDGGPNGRHQTYWENYSFGELSGTAITRKEVLQRLLPKLKIANQCSFSDRFLIVNGQLRTYKIHLGSGNILMTPNDAYLCIVPRQTTDLDKQKLMLPFEGDRTLSIILSKAFLLAADNLIRDPAILNQIKP